MGALARSLAVVVRVVWVYGASVPPDRHGYGASKGRPMGRRQLTAYIAASWTQREKLRGIRRQLQALGIRVTSQWIDTSYGYDDGDFPREANRDMADVRRADFLILDTQDKDSRGGRDWEAGYAVGLGKRIVRCGPVITPFHTHVNLGFADWPALLGYFATAMEHANDRDN